MAFQNVYHHRKVADMSSKPCEICYKPSTSVMTTPDNKDFFFVCPGHLRDRSFCTPVFDAAAAAAKKKAEMDAEVERVKKEFEEKQRKKKEKEKEKDNKAKDADDKKDKKEEEAKPEPKKDELPSAKSEEDPRIFALQKSFFQLRIEKKRSAEKAKRDRERFQNPTLFPNVPRGFP